MADRSAIEWTDKTWNPVVGCARVSAGCEHCYAETMAARVALMQKAQGRESPYLRVVDVDPRQRHLVDTAVALGDVDAPVSSIQDALQRAGVLDDDIRLVELHATKTHDAARPGVVIALVRVAEED